MKRIKMIKDGKVIWRETKAKEIPLCDECKTIPSIKDSIFCEKCKQDIIQANREVYSQGKNIKDNPLDKIFGTKY